MSITPLLTDDQVYSMEDYKLPKYKTIRYVGLELEFSCLISQYEFMKKIYDDKLNKYIQLGNDGRPSTNEETSYELKILLRENEIDKILPRIGDLLRQVNANVNKTHGFHVHLDMRNRKPDKSYYNLAQAQPLLFNLAHPSRRKSKWCVPQYTSNLIYASRNHYAAINPVLDSTKNTIEVRIREGLVDDVAIKYWVKLLIALADNSKITSSIDNLTDLAKVMRLNKEMSLYLKSLINKKHKPLRKSSSYSRISAW